MKKKNRTEILAAILAVLCIQKVELKKKVGALIEHTVALNKI